MCKSTLKMVARVNGGDYCKVYLSVKFSRFNGEYIISVRVGVKVGTY